MTGDHDGDAREDAGVERLADRAAVTDLLAGWLYRDTEDWDRLRDLFHPDGTLAITWFVGHCADFLTGSQRMGRSDLRTKHMVSNPLIRWNGDRALAETGAMVIVDHLPSGIGCTAWCRFHDRISRRDGQWRIEHRTSVYDMAMFAFPLGPVPIDEQLAASFPREYAALAYVLQLGGFPVERVFPTRFSAAEADQRAQDEAWLEGGS